ncbi:MAG: HTTM domain-containing protein [Myxococcales bacterium]
MSLTRRSQAVWLRVVDWFFEPVDARVHACVRIAYALTCLVILVELWPERMAYLSDQGSLVPIAAPLVSPLAWSRSPLVVNFSLATALAAALALLLGVAKRVSTLLLFVWHVAFMGAAYMVMSGFDMVVRLVGFVLLFAPHHDAFSLLPRRSALPEQLPSYVLRLIQFQTAVMYWATIWLKAPDPYWRNGELMAYFHMSFFARFPTPLAADYAGLSVIMTWSVIALEVALPLLLFGRNTRRVGIVLGLALHAGIAVTSRLSVFSLAMTPLYAAFLQGSDFDWLKSLWRKRDATTV